MPDAERSLEDTLFEATKIRVLNLSDTTRPTNEARVAVLFSGGVDCATLAAMAARALPEQEPIDLLNVAFESPRILKAHNLTSDLYKTPDRETGLETFQELRNAFPTRQWRFVEINVPYAETIAVKPQIMALMRPQNTVMDYVSTF